MKYKSSIYNVVISELEEGRKLFYNTYSGIFSIMDKETFNICENIKHYCPTSVSDEKITRNIDLMLRTGYIVDADKDELSTLKLERVRNRHRNQVLLLTIALTMDCNMNCPYCYEKRNLSSIGELQLGQLYDFVKVHFNTNPDIKKLSVTWYGGEPLLQKEAIYSLSEKFIELCNENEKKYSASIITNGVLLDTDTANKLATDCKVTYAQITIDGMRELHNKRRILSDGKDSFEIITNNIDACKDIIRVNVRVNTDKENAGDIDAMLNHFINERGWKSNPSFYLSPIEIDEESGCVADKTLCLQGEEFADIKIKSIRASYTADRVNVAHTFFPSRKTVFCAGEGSLNYVVDPGGNIYNCFRHVGIEEHITGHISKPFLVTENYGKWLLADIHENCKKCVYLPMCMSGCALYRFSDKGEPKCFHTSFTYKDVLKLAYEDYMTQKSILQ